MYVLTDHPLILLIVVFLALWAATRIGAAVVAVRGPLDAAMRDDFNVVLGATLTLLGLVIGFSFSMATSRYDQRKNYEEAEANAIGTAYARADLLPGADAQAIRALLRDYTALRVRYYQSAGGEELREVDRATAGVQAQLWAAVVTPAKAQPTPVSALAVAAMNDVLNSQGYTQAAWWNRIPLGAWALLFAIATCASLMIGYGSRAAGRENLLMLIVPTVVAVAYFLIADIDSPRNGVIRVAPQNLLALAGSLT